MTLRLPAAPDTVHWGVFDARLKPALTVESGAEIEVETVSGGPDALPDGDFEIPDALRRIHAETPRPLGSGHILAGPVAIAGAAPGDAAHPMLQYLAQGACMAVEDAVALAGESDVERAFRRYTEARYLRTARVQLTARLMGEIYHAEGVRRELRNRVLSGAELREGMAWLYDGP